MISGASHLSSKSASFKQLMTPGYLAPELIGDQCCRQQNLMFIPLIYEF